MRQRYTTRRSTEQSNLEGTDGTATDVGSALADVVVFQGVCALRTVSGSTTTKTTFSSSYDGVPAALLQGVGAYSRTSDLYTFVMADKLFSVTASSRSISTQVAYTTTSFGLAYG